MLCYSQYGHGPDCILWWWDQGLHQAEGKRLNEIGQRTHKEVLRVDESPKYRGRYDPKYDVLTYAALNSLDELPKGIRRAVEDAFPTALWHEQLGR